MRTTDRSAAFNRNHSVSGRHAFTVHLPRQRPGVVLNLRSYAGQPQHLSRVRVETAGARVVDVAKRYVGKARYTYGGASPRQRLRLLRIRALQLPARPSRAPAAQHRRAAARAAHAPDLRGAQARPGDLVFYMSGGSSYHVAIYAGHGWQYAAADPQDGIRYQRIWSRAVEFRPTGTDV